jgi:hypothetical protein
VYLGSDVGGALGFESGEEAVDDPNRHPGQEGFDYGQHGCESSRRSALLSLVQHFDAIGGHVHGDLIVEDYVDGVNGRWESAEVDRELGAGTSVYSTVSGLTERFLEVQGSDPLVGSVLKRTDGEAVLARMHELGELKAMKRFLCG